MSREAMLAAIEKAVEEDTRPKAVEVDGMGTFYVRVPSVAEVEAQIAEDKEAKGELGELGAKHPMALAAARLLCDENGARLFDYRNSQDVKKLASLGIERLSRLTDNFGGGNAGN